MTFPFERGCEVGYTGHSMALKDLSQSFPALKRPFANAKPCSSNNQSDGTNYLCSIKRYFSPVVIKLHRK